MHTVCECAWRDATKSLFHNTGILQSLTVVWFRSGMLRARLRTALRYLSIALTLGSMTTPSVSTGPMTLGKIFPPTRKSFTRPVNL